MTGNPNPIIQDSISSAHDAGLRYVCDDQPGIRRRRHGKNGFTYIRDDATKVRDPATLQRIRSLVIPPAWKDVWICADANGHLQATGRDDRGRKQFVYHPRYRQIRDQAKYNRLIPFARTLPLIHRATNRDLKLPALCREKVLAAVVQLLEKTLIRVGNEEYAKTNGHFGLTTLHNKHVKVNGSQVHFEFKGKSGVQRTVDLHDKRLAKIVRDCQELPGHELFQYINGDGVKRDVTSQDVNDYLRGITGQDFTAKDFRTWAGTILAARALGTLEPYSSQTQAKKNIVSAVAAVAKMLGNTKAVCRKCYIHPEIFDAYLDGSLQNSSPHRSAQNSPRTRLSADESQILMVLQRRLKSKSRNGNLRRAA